jgi:site-specific DNA-methyltransferase (adenine-specific)
MSDCPQRLKRQLRPYYQDDGVTIYHGDCREIVPQLGKFDLLLTDPPYGIGRDGGRISTGSHGGRKPYEFLGWDKEPPSVETFKILFNVTKNQIIWGGNYFTFALPPSMGWLVWDKGQDICSSDCELAFTSFSQALRRLILNRVELMKDKTNHPTQKPLKLLTWSIKQACDAQTILDPFMGSGTTLRAAKDLGRKAVGIEIEERYCEIAAKRMAQEVLSL